MIFSVVFFIFNFLFLLILLYITVIYNRKLVEEKVKLVNFESSLYKLENELDSAKRALANKSEEIVSLKVSNAELEVTLEKEREEKKREIALLTKAEERLANIFKTLSLNALKTNNIHFLNLAKEIIDGKLRDTENDLKKRETGINEVISPIKDKLEKFDREIRELENQRIEAYGSIKEQIGALIKQTSSLANALKKPQVRGKWGEIQLRRVVEMAGMVEYCDFLTHPSVIDKNDGGLLRPDLLIKMPSGKQIIIDAKVPLDFYLDAMSESDLQIQTEKLKNHSLAIKKHINDLGKKEYWNQFENTPELVVLFLTGEGVFSAALEHDPSLIEIGVEKKVIIATPIILIAILKAIAYGWKNEMIAESTQRISELGHILYERICTMGGNFDNLRKSLKSAVDYYNKTAASLEARVLPAAREFSKLGIHTKNKELNIANGLESFPRNLYSEELKVD